MRPTVLLTATLTAALLPVAAAMGGELQRFEFAQTHMGGPCRVVLYAGGAEQAGAAAQAAFGEMAAADAAFSSFDPDSELTRLNRERELEASALLFDLLATSKRLSAKTIGTFDVTVGGPADLWREARRGARLPEPARLTDALAGVGGEHLELGPGHRVRLPHPRTRLDLGGIAKGYAADRALAALQRHGVARALVEVGGELALGEPPPDSSCWRVEVVGGCPQTLCLAGRGVATSGDTEQHLEIDGRRYSHIVNPLTGMGTSHVARATVVAADATTADALATALVVMGPERAIDLAWGLEGVEASVCWNDGSSFVADATPGFDRLEAR